MSGPALDRGIGWLGAQRPAMQRLLERLVAQNSFTQDPMGVNEVIGVLEAELRRIGLATERMPGTRFGDHLFFRGKADGKPAFLVGHADTVFEPGTFEGFRVEGDLARGPGVFDMKGGLVVCLFALEALREAGLIGRVALRGMFVADEEVGSPESQPLLRSRAMGSACALGFEPGRPGDAIVTRRRGVAAVHAEATGVAAHAGNEPEKGRSAIWSLARFVDRAEGLTDLARGVGVNVGVIEGGSAKNVVASRASCEVDLRFPTSREGDELFGKLEAVAQEAALPGTRIAVSRMSSRPAMVRTEASAELAREYGACQVASGLGSGEAPLVGGGSDASVTSAMGIPSIDGLGPRGGGYHTPDERAELGSLVPKAEALLRFLAARAG